MTEFQEGGAIVICINFFWCVPVLECTHVFLFFVVVHFFFFAFLFWCVSTAGECFFFALVIMFCFGARMSLLCIYVYFVFVMVLVR